MTLRAMVVDDEPLARERLTTMLTRVAGVEPLEAVDSGTTAIDRVAVEVPDLLFLDVEMPHLDGFDVIESLARNGGPSPLIVLVTAHDCHASSAFDWGVVDFLTKPVRLSRLEMTVGRAQQVLDQRDAVARLHRATSQLAALRSAVGGRIQGHVWVRRRGEAVRIDFSQIDRIVAEGEYVRIVVGDADYLHRESLTSMFSRLDPSLFVRVHRSLVVSRGNIATIRRGATGSYRLTTRDGSEWPVGRSYRATVREIVGSTVAS